MNLKNIMAEFRLEEDDVLELMEIFIASSIEDLDPLDSAIKGNIAPEVARYAHSIRGAALHLRLGEISETAREIEINARNGILEGSLETATTLRSMLKDFASTISRKGIFCVQEDSGRR